MITYEGILASSQKVSGTWNLHIPNLRRDVGIQLEGGEARVIDEAITSTDQRVTAFVSGRKLNDAQIYSERSIILTTPFTRPADPKFRLILRAWMLALPVSSSMHLHLHESTEVLRE